MLFILKTFSSTLNSWIGEFVFWCNEQVTNQQRIHQIVSPISNSDSTIFFNEYVLQFCNFFFNWQTEKQNVAQTEKKIVKQMGENIDEFVNDVINMKLLLKVDWFVQNQNGNVVPRQRIFVSWIILFVHLPW